MRREGGCEGECGAMLCVVTELVEELSVSVCSLHCAWKFYLFGRTNSYVKTYY
jgi:hypothetical protein